MIYVHCEWKTGVYSNGYQFIGKQWRVTPCRRALWQRRNLLDIKRIPYRKLPHSDSQIYKYRSSPMVNPPIPLHNVFFHSFVTCVVFAPVFNCIFLSCKLFISNHLHIKWNVSAASHTPIMIYEFYWGFLFFFLFSVCCWLLQSVHSCASVIRWWDEWRTSTPFIFSLPFFFLLVRYYWLST